MNIVPRYMETRDWIIFALIEKIEGHVVPRDQRLSHKISQDGIEQWFWNNILILECTLKGGRKNYEDGESQEYIEGYFMVPPSLNDEYINERATNWMK